MSVQQVIESNSTTESAEEILVRAKDAHGAELELLQNRAIEASLDLAFGLARKYDGRGVSLDDLEQVACLGLVKAVRRFDPDQGRFGAFAKPTILGELKRHFRDSAWAVRPPRRLQELQAGLTSAFDEYVQRHGENPTTANLADSLETRPDEIRAAQQARSGFRAVSLEKPIGETGKVLADTITAEDHTFETCDALVSLGPHCRALTQEDRTLLELRFFAGKSQQEIAEHFGITQMQISRRLKRVLRTLREALSEETPSDEVLVGEPQPTITAAAA